MNILILTTCLSSGGAERVAAQLSVGLSERHEVSVCVFSREEGVDYSYAGELIDLGMDLSAGTLEKLFSLYRNLPDLTEIKRTREIDSTISLLNGPNIANLMTPAGDRRVISIRNCLSRTFSGVKNIPRRVLIRLLYDRADGIVTLSDGVRLDAIKHGLIGGRKATTIYNPADVEGIEEQASESLDPAYDALFTNPSLINVGRLTEQKGQHHLLHIFERVQTEVPDANLIILGKGERRTELVRLCHDLDLRPHVGKTDPPTGADVYFLEFHPNPFPFIRAADGFVLTSLWEGLGNVIIESLACGTPVVSSDCQYGPREILAPSTAVSTSTHTPETAAYGLLMPDFNARARRTTSDDLYTSWSHTIVDLLNKPSLREKYRERGKQRACDFSLEQVTQNWEDLLMSLA